MNRLARLKLSHKQGYDFFCLGLLCILGISFCFFLGFPFANHNESYLWLAQLKQMSLIDVITHQVSPVATVRPLGTATAWITYHLTGNIYFQQLINYAFVISSILLLFKFSLNKVFYAYLSLINGSFFFSGYIYLFHLHGVFYGPFQLYLAFLIVVAVKYRHLSLRMFLLISIAGLLISLFHTFTLLILICFYLGYLLKEFNYKNIIRTAVAILTCITLSKILSPSFVPESLAKMFLGFIATYKSIELNWIQSLIASGLAIIVSLQLAKGRIGHLLVALATALTAIVLFKFKIPVLFLLDVTMFYNTIK